MFYLNGEDIPSIILFIDIILNCKQLHLLLSYPFIPTLCNYFTWMLILSPTPSISPIWNPWKVAPCQWGQGRQQWLAPRGENPNSKGTTRQIPQVAVGGSPTDITKKKNIRSEWQVPSTTTRLVFVNILGYKIWCAWDPWSLTARPWKMMVGRLLTTLLLGRAIFRVYVKIPGSVCTRFPGGKMVVLIIQDFQKPWHQVKAKPCKAPSADWAQLVKPQ